MPVGAKLTTVLFAAVLAVGWTPVPAAAEPAPRPAASQFLGAVTLVTGDHVTVRRVGSRLVPHVQPAPGREHVHFATTGVGDALLVVPADAWAPVRTGQLDQRLFDVAGLLRDGFGDSVVGGVGGGGTGRADLPLIVQGDAGADATVTHTLSTVDAVAVRQPKATTADFWANRGGGRIWLDGIRRPSLDTSVTQINAPAAWRAGYTGTGVPVAVLDTGIDATHPDLRRQIVATKNFTTDRNVRDLDGHGTHVASTIAGTGTASDGRYTGVAPGAKLLVGKVCGGYGCPESAILAGMEWAADRGAKVVNLSLGGPDTAADDPLELAVERLSAEHGTLFVVAAGNDGGYGAETVSSPASADAALAVGAVDDQDVIAGFSSRGPRVHDAALKPEITAPGVEIMAALSRYSERGGKRERYVTMSGTSMATPHVAGTAALLAQRHPDWTGEQLKAALIASAQPGTGDVFAQGAGRVDAGRAVTQTVTAEPTTVSIGRMAWPHEDDAPVTRTVTYRNDGDEQQTLRLSLTAGGPGGAPVPDGMFRLSAATVTVPANGRAGVDVTVNTALPAEEGTFGAHVVATDDAGGQVSTPVAVDREPECYDLSLKTLDATGAPTDNHYSFVFGIDRERYRPVPGVGGAGTLRVRAGTYHVDAAVSTPRKDGLYDSAKVVHPTVEVRADTTVVLDARSAHQVAVTFDRPNVAPRGVAVAYSRNTPHSLLNTGVLGDTFDRISIGQVGAPVPDEELVASVGGVWAVPDRHGDVLRSTVTYNLSWFDYGGVPTGFRRHIVDGELARVDATYREQTDRRRATKVWLAREPRFDVSNGFGFGFRLPLERTEFHNTDGLTWSAELEQWTMVKKQLRTETVLTGGPVDHVAGQSYVEDWNTAVFGPGFTEGGEFAIRSGDVLTINLPLYSDAGLDRAGLSLVDAGSTVLYRDGEKVGETAQPGIGQFEVPAEEAPYRLEVQARRSGVSELSTQVSGVWTFTSVRPPEEDPKGKGGAGLPLMAVRFVPPDLDDRNTVRADTVRIPVTVQRQSGAPVAALGALSVDVSFDDGRTWRPAEVAPDRQSVTITHPRSARYVSLRAHATDTDGNGVTQTVLRAYRSR